MPFKPVDFYILFVLTDGPRHGDGIMKELERESNGEVRLETGSMYRILSRLLTEGGFEAEGDKRLLVNSVRVRRSLPEENA
jgi:DNA-binding PadR family transcriptional regulator